MPATSLSQIDLNLLVTLQALLEERNVTRAAQRLHLTQPSVSVRLAKLRRIFRDPLLVAGPRGMLPTKRALELVQPLRAMLNGLTRLLSSEATFDPENAEVTWHISCADYAAQAILLPFLTELPKEAPSTRIAIHPVAHEQATSLTESGTVDLALMARDFAPPSLRSKVLFKERYVLAARRTHPLFKQPLTLPRFCELDHVLVSPEGGGFVGPTDVALRNLGRERRVSVSVPHFLFVPELLRNSDLVAVLPERLLASGAHGLRVVDPPLAVPGYEMIMVWHERSHLDPAHRWLRDRIGAAIERP
jgi:DNA-binding transcriptional LysR family regulator